MLLFVKSATNCLYNKDILVFLRWEFMCWMVVVYVLSYTVS